MSNLEEIKTRQSKILDRYHSRIFDPADSFSYEAFRNLSHTFFINAEVLQPTKEGKDFMSVAEICADQSPEKIIELYESRFDLSRMVDIALPSRQPSPFGN